MQIDMNAVLPVLRFWYGNEVQRDARRVQLSFVLVVESELSSQKSLPPLSQGRRS